MVLAMNRRKYTLAKSLVRQYILSAAVLTGSLSVADLLQSFQTGQSLFVEELLALIVAGR